MTMKTIASTFHIRGALLGGLDFFFIMGSLVSISSFGILYDGNRQFQQKDESRLFTVPLFSLGILETGTLRWKRRHLGL